MKATDETRFPAVAQLTPTLVPHGAPAQSQLSPSYYKNLGYRSITE
jgi:hypothetical protein